MSDESNVKKPKLKKETTGVDIIIDVRRCSNAENILCNSGALENVRAVYVSNITEMPFTFNLSITDVKRISNSSDISTHEVKVPDIATSNDRDTFMFLAGYHRAKYNISETLVVYSDRVKLLPMLYDMFPHEQIIIVNSSDPIYIPPHLIRGHSRMDMENACKRSVGGYATLSSLKEF
jgi:hypothetical protein